MGRHAKYPYDRWRDGLPHTLVRGVDFDCSVAAMRTRVHEYGNANGFEVRTVSPHEDMLIVVMFRV